jgi:DNA-binding FadR family transcriptional regulator
MRRIEEAMAGFETSVKTGRDSVDADLALHHAIASAAGNPLFVSLMEFTQTALRDMLVASHRSMMTLEGSLMRVHKEHKAIVRAIRDRDESAARRAAANHLTCAANRMSITFS